MSETIKLKNGKNDVAIVNNKNIFENKDNENEVEWESIAAAYDETPNLGDFNDLLHVMRYLEENIVVKPMVNNVKNNGETNGENN